MGALTRDINDRKKSCSLSLTVEKLPFKAREGSGKSSKPEQEPGGKDLREETVILLSFYNVILICCPQKWLSFLETEDTETSEDEEPLAHGAQKVAFRSHASPLAQGLAKTGFLDQHSGPANLGSTQQL